jgi:CheY-like chemotaxis protein
VNVLVVMPDEVQAAALHTRFEKRMGEDLHFESVVSGVEALKRLTRARADLLISAATSEDLKGLELLSRVRQLEPEVAFVLLDRSALSHFTPTRFDAVLDAYAHPADVLEAAFSLLVSNGQLHEHPRPFYGTFRKGSRPGVKISGTLEVMTLFDLVLSLTQKRNSGQLFLLLGAVEAVLAFEQGKLVHAAHQDLTGEAAVLKIFHEAELHPSTEFFFEPGELRLPPGGATLHTSVQELLLKVAVELDHLRQPAS